MYIESRLHAIKLVCNVSRSDEVLEIASVW